MHIKHLSKNFTQKSTSKLLGITTDGYLKFSKHIANISKKVSRKCNSPMRISSLLIYQHKIFFLNSSMNVQFNHCPLSWAFSSISSNIKFNKLHETSLRHLSQTTDLYVEKYSITYRLQESLIIICQSMLIFDLKL